MRTATWARSIIAAFVASLSWSQTALAVLDRGPLRTLTTDGGWGYSRTVGQPDRPDGASYVPLFEDYRNVIDAPRLLLPAPLTSGATGGDAWFGPNDFVDQSEYFRFSTYIQSDFDQTINLGLAGDDGHSIYVGPGSRETGDPVLLAGAPVAVMSSAPLSLQAGVPKTR